MAQEEKVPLPDILPEQMLRVGIFFNPAFPSVRFFIFSKGDGENSHNLLGLRKPDYQHILFACMCVFCYPQATFHPTWPSVTIRKVRTQIPVRISKLWFSLDIFKKMAVKRNLLSGTHSKYEIIYPGGGRRGIVCSSSNVFESERSEESVNQLKFTEEEKGWSENYLVRNQTHSLILGS